mgnify:CR=1 FL=1
MKAIIKEVVKEPKVIDVENTLEALQKAVGGYLEAVRVGNGVIMLCDEEGRMKGSPYNFDLGSEKIVGNVIFTNNDDSKEDFADLDDKQIETVLHFFSRTPYTT